jgi:hypothetical protein
VDAVSVGLAALACAPAALGAQRGVVSTAESPASVAVTLNRQTGSSPATVAGTLTVDAPAGGPVRVTAMHLDFPARTVGVPVTAGTTSVAVSAAGVDLGAAGLTLAAVPIPGGVSLAGGTCGGVGAGAITYSVAGLTCNSYQSAGVACSGAPSMAGATVRVASGTLVGSRLTLMIEVSVATPPLASGWGGVSYGLTLAADLQGGPACVADFNGNGAADLLDIFAFLSAWFAGDPRADVGGAPGVELLDIFVFLNAWFAGCP